MPKRRFALQPGGPKALLVRWRGRLKDFEVEHEGRVWKLDRATVEQGATIALPDGARLAVQSVRRKWWSIALRDELRVERAGVPLPGSDGDPRVVCRRAARVIGIFGLLRVLFGGLWALFASGNAGFTVPVAGAGVLLLGLAVLAALGWRLPIALAAGVFALEVLVAFAVLYKQPNLGTLIQVLVIVHLVDAWRRTRPRPSIEALGAVFE